MPPETRQRILPLLHVAARQHHLRTFSHKLPRGLKTNAAVGACHQGDFALVGTKVASAGSGKLTFSGLAAYHRALFASITTGQKQPLAPLLKSEAQAGRVSGEHYTGTWIDVGTPERLDALNVYLSQNKT